MFPFAFFPLTDRDSEEKESDTNHSRATPPDALITSSAYSPPLSPPSSDDDRRLYQFSIRKSLEFLQDIATSPLPPASSPSSPFPSPKSLFTIDKGTGKSIRYTLRTKTKRYFYIFPWIFYLNLKKTQRNDTSFFRETMEEEYMEKVLETMNYFYGDCKEKGYIVEELLYLEDIFQGLEWEKDKEKNVITRIIQISSNLKRYRSFMNPGRGMKIKRSQSQLCDEEDEESSGKFLFHIMMFITILHSQLEGNSSNTKKSRAEIENKASGAIPSLTDPDVGVEEEEMLERSQQSELEQT